MAIRRTQLFATVAALDAAGAVVAARHRVAGEPFGFGGAFDVRRPAVLFWWGSGLSAPLASLLGAALFARRSPRSLRVVGAMLAVGGLSEPAFWGRRQVPRYARAMLVAHVALGSALALAPLPD